MSLSQVEDALLRPLLSNEGSKKIEENRSCELAAVCAGLTDGNTEDGGGNDVVALVFPFSFSDTESSC